MPDQVQDAAADDVTRAILDFMRAAGFRVSIQRPAAYVVVMTAEDPDSGQRHVVRADSEYGAAVALAEAVGFDLE